MTEKITEGLARGRAKKTGGVLINTFKNQSTSFIKTAGFFALWSVLGCGTIVMDDGYLKLLVNLQGYSIGNARLYLHTCARLCIGHS